MQKFKFPFKIIVPFALSIFFITVFALISIYTFQTKHIDDVSKEKFKNISNIFTQTIQKDTELFKGLSELFQKDENVINLYETKNRESLFLYLHQTYLSFNRRYNITHLYIHNLDKTNFLRVHNKNLHSDLINRFTLNKAVETSVVSSGIEFSLNNHYTLRVVSPWIDNENVIGYIEIGEEIDNITNELSKTLHENIILTINKKMIIKNDYKNWEQENSNNKKYTELDNFYIINSTLAQILPQQELLKILDNKSNAQNIRVENNNVIYNINSKSFYDVTGNEVGKIYLLSDVTSEIQELKLTIIKTFFLLILTIFVIIYFYFKYINRIDKKMKDYINVVEFNYKFEQYINNISNYLVYNNDTNQSIDKTLQELGIILDANRTYLFMFKENYTIMDNTHEWCSDGVEPEIDNLHNESTEYFSWWVEQCKEQKAIVVEDINQMPKEAENEKIALLEQNIKSLLVYPILSKGEVSGFIGIDMVLHYQKWSETHHSFIKITAESISNALDKKRFEEELLKSHDDMALTLNTASNGILVINENGKITLYNKRFIDMWQIKHFDSGFTIKELLEKISSMILNSEECLKTLSYLEENLYEEISFITFLKDGRIFEITSIPRLNENTFRGRSFSLKDITKRILSEKELQLSAKVFENSSEGIMITDANTNIIKVNTSFLKVTGYNEDEILGKKPSILQSHWHDKEFYEEMWKSLQENSIWEGEVKDRRKNGELYISLSTVIAIKDNVGEVINYIGINRDVTDMKKVENHIKALAYYDSLTNLPNRTLFYDRLEQSTKYCERNKGKVALLFIDLDNFKIVNDTYGHHVGDLLLQRVAQLLIDSVRDSDTVSRLGGDEFTIILRRVHDKDNVTQVANKIITQLLEPIVINDIPLKIGSSIGAAIFPDDAIDRDTLIRMADSAMYIAKTNGKNCLKFFEKKNI